MNTRFKKGMTPWNKGMKYLQIKGEKNHWYKHGFARTHFYVIYSELRSRCINKKSTAYYNYGGRGIKCIWKSFQDFKNDMYESYRKHRKDFGRKNTTIDRVDNNGNYCKENCRWATRIEQNNNTRRNRIVEFGGRKKTMAQWIKISGIKSSTVRQRFYGYRWPIEKCFNYQFN